MVGGSSPSRPAKRSRQALVERVGSVWHDGRVLKRALVIACAAAMWMAQPSPAFAHAGRSPLVAVDDQARITEMSPSDAPFRVRVVDGDQDLWLRIQPGNDLVILGSIGEPFLRFEGGWVWANTHSTTAETDLFGLVPSRPSLDPRKPPQWWHVARGDSYLWHDHRLHALALLAGGGPAHRLGTWTIPLELNGSRGLITGDLTSVDPPATWFWSLLSLTVVAGAVLVLRLGDQRLVRRAAVIAAAVAITAVVVARAGRDLYGRPEVTTARFVSIGVGLVLAGIAYERLLRGGLGVKLVVTMIAGVLGIVQGLTLLPAFWHGLVLVAVPAWIERICIALCLGAGIASLIFTFAGRSDMDEPHQDGMRQAPAG